MQRIFALYGIKFQSPDFNFVVISVVYKGLIFPSDNASK